MDPCALCRSFPDEATNATGWQSRISHRTRLGHASARRPRRRRGAAQPGQVASAHDASTVPARTGDTVTFSGTSRGLASAEVYCAHSSSASVS